MVKYEGVAFLWGPFGFGEKGQPIFGYRLLFGHTPIVGALERSQMEKPFRGAAVGKGLKSPNLVILALESDCGNWDLLMGGSPVGVP